MNSGSSKTTPHLQPQWSTWEVSELVDHKDISSKEEEEQCDTRKSASATTKGTAAGGSKGKSKKENDVRPEALVRKKCA